MAQFNFNSNEVPADDFDTIPAGVYSAQIIQSEMKDTKAGTGQYLEMRIQVLDEPFTGRLVFERLNLINPNPTAVKIANRTLADICNAIDVDSFEDTEELHGIEFKIKLIVEEPPEGTDYSAQNKVKKYLKS